MEETHTSSVLSLLLTRRPPAALHLSSTLVNHYSSHHVMTSRLSSHVLQNHISVSHAATLGGADVAPGPGGPGRPEPATPLREDVVDDGGRQAALLSNAPKGDRGFFLVPLTLGKS